MKALLKRCRHGCLGWGRAPLRRRCGGNFASLSSPWCLSWFGLMEEEETSCPLFGHCSNLDQILSPFIINDTIKGCYYAWKINKNRHYSLSNPRSYTIKSVAKLFTNNIEMIPAKLGERKKSSVVKKIGNIKIYPFSCKINLKSYIKDFKNTLSKDGKYKV